MRFSEDGLEDQTGSRTGSRTRSRTRTRIRIQDPDSAVSRVLDPSISDLSIITQDSSTHGSMNRFNLNIHQISLKPASGWLGGLVPV